MGKLIRLLVAVAFCGLRLATVLADARLQARITGRGRATVTSLAGMATDGTVIVVYGAYGLVATVAGNGVAFAVAALLLGEAIAPDHTTSSITNRSSGQWWLVLISDPVHRGEPSSAAKALAS